METGIGIMNNLSKIKTITSFLCLISLLLSSLAVSGQATVATESCYSAYQLKQKLLLSVVLGDSIQKQNIHLEMDVHAREVETSQEFLVKLERQKKYSPENVRSYVILLMPRKNKVNGVNSEFAQRYQHPFLANVDELSGELIDIVSTTNEKNIVKEYLGYFDLFQYSTNDGHYRYRNGNGNYNAQIEYPKSETNSLSKTNRGYLDSNKFKILQNNTLIQLTPSDIGNHCFYQSARVTEVFTNTLTKDSYMKGDASISITIDNKTKLPEEHFFHSLTNDLTQWPTYNREEKLTRRQAFKRLPVLFSQLQFLVDDKTAFLTLFKTEKALWPYLADFMTQEGSDSALVNRVIWSLNRINTTESVSSLLKVTMSELPSKNVYRSILAMITSSAEIDPQSIDDLKNYLSDFKYAEETSQEALLLLRSLGAMAKHRSQHSPMQSEEIKQYLYTQLTGAGNQFKSSLYESIGALGNSIDREGVELLMHGLSEQQTAVKDSAINALTKIPYQKNNSDLYIAKLETELHSTTKNKLIELLGKTDKEDTLVKDKLLDIVNEPNNFSQSKNSIASLKKIGFEFSDSEIQILESRLRTETDKSSQTKLASLILKHRRR